MAEMDTATILTKRETEVLKDVVEGMNYVQIAAKTGKHVNTVRLHVLSVKAKLGLDPKASRYEVLVAGRSFFGEAA